MNMSSFQLIVLSIFGFFILAGVGAFALFGGGNGAGQVGAVVIWGTTDSYQFETMQTALLHNHKELQDVSYVQKKPETYASELVDAMAAGSGPDLFMIDQSSLTAFSDKITPISYGTYSQKTFVDSFVRESSLFLTSGGILALPFTIDPLVMYWNKNHFVSAGEATPPQYWSELVALAPKLTIVGNGSTITRSGLSIGEWSNVTHAKEVLSALFMQSGESIVITDSVSGKLRSVFGTTPPGATANPAQAALMFYTQFADPVKTSYSWNRAQRPAREAFIAGETSIYFGPASEYRAIALANPNLSFGVAMLPQVQSSSDLLTFGTLTALAVPRTSRNPQGALTVATTLSGLEAQTLYSQQTGLPPVRTDFRVDTSANAAAEVFVRSSLIARGWHEPSPQSVDAIFKKMIEAIQSGRSQPAGAVADASAELERALR